LFAYCEFAREMNSDVRRDARLVPPSLYTAAIVNDAETAVWSTPPKVGGNT